MTLIQKRKKVKKLIETADVRLLNEIIKLAESESKKVVGYTTDGADLTKGELMQIVHEAEVRYKKGGYVTHEKATKQMLSKDFSANSPRQSRDSYATK